MTQPDPGRFRTRASGTARVYNNSGRMSFDNRQYDNRRIEQVGDRYDFGFDPADGFFRGRGPGRVLMGLGLCVALFCFAGWMSIVVTGMQSDSVRSGDPLGVPLGSGMPVGALYLLGVPFGGILAVIGRSMAKAAADRRGPHIGHLVTTMLIAGVGVIAVVYALGGSPVSTLVPSFSGPPVAAVGPPVPVSAAGRTKEQSGLTLTVTRIENVAGRGVVHLRARNTTSSSIGLVLGWFKVTDGDGTTYQPDPFAGDWNEDVGAGADQKGTVTLDKPVVLGTGKLRVEFTTVMGRSGGIAVTAIPSR